LIRETTENESANEGYRFGQEEETYNIVAAHGYFGELPSQYQERKVERSERELWDRFHVVDLSLWVCVPQNPNSRNSGFDRRWR
jgi:hypothetical protein